MVVAGRRQGEIHQSRRDVLSEPPRRVPRLKRRRRTASLRDRNTSRTRTGPSRSQHIPISTYATPKLSTRHLPLLTPPAENPK